jgi:hypothetical protein
MFGHPPTFRLFKNRCPKDIAALVAVLQIQPIIAFEHPYVSIARILQKERLVNKDFAAMSMVNRPGVQGASRYRARISWGESLFVQLFRIAGSDF